MSEIPVLDQGLAWLILISFSIFWIFLGYYLGRKNTDVEAYMLAGRKVGLALGMTTAMATWVTSNTTMAAPQLAFQMGIWGMIGYSLGSVGLILFAPLARRIRELMPTGFTSGDFIRLRYGKTAWRIFLGISLFYGLGWLVSLGMAGGVLINTLTGINYHVGMSLMLLMCVLYTMLGGLRAVIGTDFIQTLIILCGLVIVAFLVIDHVGLNTIYSSVKDERPQLLNLLFPAAIMFLFNNLLFGIGEIFHSNVWWSRAFAFREGVGFKAYLLAGLFWAPVPIVAGFLALSVPALGVNIPLADQVGPMVVAEILGQAGAVLVFIIIFSALASSLDSLLAALSDLVLIDIYKGHIKPQTDPQTLQKVAPWIVLLLGIFTWLLCLPRITTLAELLYFTGAFVASTIWPITVGLYWRNVNPAGVSAAMFFGTLIGLASYFLIGFYVAALVSAGVSMVIVLLSTLLKPVTFDWHTLNVTHSVRA